MILNQKNGESLIPGLKWHSNLWPFCPVFKRLQFFCLTVVIHKYQDVKTLDSLAAEYLGFKCTRELNGLDFKGLL